MADTSMISSRTNPCPALNGLSMAEVEKKSWPECFLDEKADILFEKTGDYDEDAEDTFDCESYELSYDYTSEEGYTEKDIYETFCGTWDELQSYIRELRNNGCYNIHADSLNPM